MPTTRGDRRGGGPSIPSAPLVDSQLDVVLLDLSLSRVREVVVVLATPPGVFVGELYALWAAAEPAVDGDEAPAS